MLCDPVVANSPSFYTERAAFGRASPARVKSANPRFPDGVPAVTSAVPRTVLKAVFAQLMAEDQGNYSICLRHQRKVIPIVMLFKGFANLRVNYRSQRELVVGITRRL